MRTFPLFSRASQQLALHVVKCRAGSSPCFEPHMGELVVLVGLLQQVLCEPWSRSDCSHHSSTSSKQKLPASEIHKGISMGTLLLRVSGHKGFGASNMREF